MVSHVQLKRDHPPPTPSAPFGKITSSTHDDAQGRTLEHIFFHRFQNQIAHYKRLLVLSTFLPSAASNSLQEKRQGRKICPDAHLDWTLYSQKEGHHVMADGHIIILLLLLLRPSAKSRVVHMTTRKGGPLNIFSFTDFKIK
mmetsp:Transcript_15970/g.25857  ORF Transcript_15970/g.25857 Transcript_15970/m.25857 type:complete len:142 (+) Transcript_15970:279-704(+)